MKPTMKVKARVAKTGPLKPRQWMMMKGEDMRGEFFQQKAGYTRREYISQQLAHTAQGELEHLITLHASNCRYRQLPDT